MSMQPVNMKKSDAEGACCEKDHKNRSFVTAMGFVCCKTSSKTSSTQSRQIEGDELRGNGQTEGVKMSWVTGR